LKSGLACKSAVSHKNRKIRTKQLQVILLTGKQPQSFAGSDTTSAAVAAIFYYLMRTPHAYKKLMDEIDEATKDGRLSAPAVKYSEAAKLPYLDACCKEGMRMHPSVGLTMPRHVPAGGCSIAGRWVSGGMRVGVNAAVVHREKRIFGPDANEYNPDRWFRDDAANMDRYMFQVCGFSILSFSFITTGLFLFLQATGPCHTSTSQSPL
jgi:cytochrome P450